MMTSSNGNIFRVTGPLCGEVTGPGDSPHKGQWRGALMFSFICVWINDWVNNREAGDLRRYSGHYDVIVMYWSMSYMLLQLNRGGWWFTSCYKANLHGEYIPYTNGWPRCHRTRGCISWQTIENYEEYSLKMTEMKILPTDEYY